MRAERVATTDATPRFKLSSWLVCPECAFALQEGAEEVRCSACHKAWALRNSAPHFDENFPYWGEIPLEQMGEVNRAAEAGVGFRKVEVYRAIPSYNYPRFMIPLKRNIFSYYSSNFNSGHASPRREFLRRILRRLGLLQYLEYSFVVLACQ